MPHTYLISGTSRGLGLGLVRYLLSSSKQTKVIAGVRNPSSAIDLQSLVDDFGNERLHLLKLDVENAVEVKNALADLESSGFLGDGGLDTLIANAGISNALPPPSETTPELVQANLNVNLYGVMNLVTSSLPLLRKGQAKQIFAVSSTVGSLGGLFSENSLYTAYCMSKTILNMYMRKLSVELKEEGFTVVMYSPGFVKTDLIRRHGRRTGGQARVRLPCSCLRRFEQADGAATTGNSVENVIRKVTKADNGKFLDVDGSVAPCDPSLLSLSAHTTTAGHALLLAMAQTTENTSPEIAILSNEAALHALKRPQLVSLAKAFGVKASGKNIEIIARLQEHGRWITQPTDEDVLEEGDASTASWAVVRDHGVSTGSAEPVLGVPSTSSTSSTGSSYASDSLRSTIPTLRAKSSAEGNDFASLVYPSLPISDTSADRDFSMDADMDGEDGIRMVSSRSTLHQATSEAGDEPAPPVPNLPMSPPAFVFGSPPPASIPSAPTSTFTFSMPGALSTSSTASEATAAPAPDSMDAGKSAAEQIMEEMNRRVAEARAAAEADGLTRLRTTLFGTGKSKGTAPSPEKGSKQAFDVHHKRNFAKMDSITNHWAAKRPHPSTSTSSGNIAGMARSTSSRTLTASTSTERPNKRLKASSSISSTLNRLPSSTSNRHLVNALRDEGWSAAPAASTSVSLSASVRSGGPGRPRAKEMREDLKPVAEKEREQRRRQLELAKARRKSQAGTGVGLSRRRPSLGVGPKPPSFSASGFLKKTFRKLASAPAPPTAPPTAAPRPPLPSTSSIRRLATDRPTKPLPSPARTPRFAAPTASTSARALSAAKPNAASPSPKKQPGWKKFDLQESLRRPMAWKTGQAGSSPAVARAAPGVSRQVSARVANPSMLGHVKAPAAQGDTSSAAAPVSVAPNASLSPTSPAPKSSTPFAPLTNLAPTLSFPSTAASASSSSSWQPPAITKRPNLPLSSPAKKSASSASTSKKVVSSSSRLARAGEKGRGRTMAGEVESRARMVRATK
ncbi:Proteophosphoglycan 5 [Rhodotorula toruloides]